ncbi:hypothetical protein KSP39_PZI006196 [Platanthera zijinensis]|uniref:Uncharacterized protein n=1 Tax=Platanthera zijinensis TaxID=2320716 RepID=A0AAP0BR18_9ASPA
MQNCVANKSFIGLEMINARFQKLPLELSPDVPPTRTRDFKTSRGGESGAPVGLGTDSKSQGRIMRSVIISPPSFRHPASRNVFIISPVVD